MSTNRGTKPEVKEDDRKVLGNRLREAREYLGFSQEEVANYLGVPRTALTSIEAGTRKVDALELKKLSSLFKRPVAHFTGEEVGDDFGDEEVAHLARKARELPPEDRAELGRFADFLRAKKQAKGD
jgi:transcriptional regulator with XRE-family HTH domain